MNETTTKERTMSKQMHVSHASCNHDKTPAERAKCRRIRRGGAPETSKAEIVTRVKKTKAPVLREMLSLDNENELPDHNVFSSKYGKNVPLKELEAAEACEQDDVKVVQVNVIAKGSKVVHTSAYDEDGEMMFACTKRLVNVDTATITTNDVTCKNCLKITK